METGDHMILQKIVKATQARLEARKKEYPIEIIKIKYLSKDRYKTLVKKSL